jgi:hypothetical protein
MAMIFPMAEVDPNTVRPGWIALLIVLALGAATVLLWRNMGKQLKKIDFDPGNGPDTPAKPAGPDDRPTVARPKRAGDGSLQVPGDQVGDPVRGERRPPT